MNAITMIRRCAARQDVDPAPAWLLAEPQSRALDARLTEDADWIAAQPQQSLPDPPVTSTSQSLEVPS